MSTIRKLKAEAAKLGATVVDESGHYITYQVEAPEGMVWACDGISTLCVATARGDKSWLVDAIDDALERMAYGLEEAEEE